MKQGNISNEGSYLRCLLLLLFLGFLKFKITPTAAFQIVRPSPWYGIGQDRYDRGNYVYRNQIVDVDCARSGECQCDWGGTFVFEISSNGILQPTCIYRFSDVFGMIFICTFDFFEITTVSTYALDIAIYKHQDGY